MVVIARHIPIAAICNGAGHAAEIVPDGRAFAIGARSAFNLKCAGGDAPHEILWKAPTQIQNRDRGVHFRLGFGAPVDSRTISSTDGRETRGRSFFRSCNIASAELSPSVRTDWRTLVSGGTR